MTVSTFMPALDFARIAAHLGGRHESFEELCCQLARRADDVPEGAEFVRLRGTGGDGGVECYWRLASGREWGWQAKYIFDLGEALQALSKSLETAIRVHPELERYYVCLPFDLTGPTGRRGKSQLERFDEWREREVEKARRSGCDLRIELESASTLGNRLVQCDPSGGRRLYWFGENVLTEEWFGRHLEDARTRSYPRYTPELSLEAPVARAFDALCLSRAWLDSLEERAEKLHELAEKWGQSVGATREGAWATPFPDELREEGRRSYGLAADVAASVAKMAQGGPAADVVPRLGEVVAAALAALEPLEAKLVEGLDAKYGIGKADSASFRQFEAEYNVRFPAINLDRARDLIASLDDLAQWAESPIVQVAGKRDFLLTGVAGAGKTHAICDAATRAAEAGGRSLVLFAELFSGTREPWAEAVDQLGLPPAMGRDALLEALDAAGEASGQPLVIFVDGINETLPRSYWRDRMYPFVSAIRRHGSLRACLSCRTSYLSQVVPDARDLPVIEHTGFGGMEFDACKAFFSHYGLEPPVAPVLHPEFANPLFLRLLCEAMKGAGLVRLPHGWLGLNAVISAFLASKNRFYSERTDSDARHRVPERSLEKLVETMRSTFRSTLPFDEAAQLVQPLSLAPNPPLIDWLVREGLLIVDARADGSGDQVRIAFERLGDHLLASKYIDGMDAGGLGAMVRSGGPLAFCFESRDAVQNNMGLVEALAVQVPERLGVELTEATAGLGDRLAKNEVLKACVRTLAWRSPELMHSAARGMVEAALGLRDFATEVFESLLAVAPHASSIDAFYLHDLLVQRPLAERDQFWCGFLHMSYEGRRAVRRLISSALEIDPTEIGAETAERWATVLLWFCAAADRRVRDAATKGAVRITEHVPQVWEPLVARFSQVDDDYVLERCVACAYGVLLRATDLLALGTVAGRVSESIFGDPARVQNALIRDHARCILQFANLKGVLPEGIGEAAYLPPYSSKWPLEVPSEEDVRLLAEKGPAVSAILHSCTDDDFFTYTMSCLDGYEHAMPRGEMGRWIFAETLQMGYAEALFGNYDGYMRYKYGGGRGRPGWAERIGKKYQLVALARLAARLGDNLKPERDGWDPEPLCVPLVFPSGRDIDPSLLVREDASDEDVPCWWNPHSYDFDRGADLPDSQWIADGSDFPDSSQLLFVEDPHGKTWLAVESHPAWTWSRPGSKSPGGSRHLWTQVRGYLVRSDDAEKCWSWLASQDFMGRWMPEGADFHEGFVGEYPWGPSYNVYEDSHLSGGGYREGELPAQMVPAANTVYSSYSEDAFQSGSASVNVPAKVLMAFEGLVWDGGSGFRADGGETAFADPSLVIPGPSVLLADPDFIGRFLAASGMALVWTALAEKIVPGDNKMKRARCSRVHMLVDGSIRSSDPTIAVE
ncbi:MAG: hypothetical protein ACO1SV_07985 [Fimbriimonas sp.]